MSGAWATHRFPVRGKDALRRRSRESIGPLRDGDGPLRVVPQSQAGNAQNGRLLLNAP